MVLLTDINQHFPVIIEKYQFINKNNDQNKPPSRSPHHNAKKTLFQIETCAEIQFKISFI